MQINRHQVLITMEEHLPSKSHHSQSTHSGKFIFWLLWLCHMVLPTIQRDDSAKGLPGQSVTLSQFCALSTLKRALMLTLAPSEVSNDWDDTFQHLLRSSHFSSSSKTWGQNIPIFIQDLCNWQAYGVWQLFQLKTIKTDRTFADKQAEKKLNYRVRLCWSQNWAEPVVQVHSTLL